MAKTPKAKRWAKNKTVVISENKGMTRAAERSRSLIQSAQANKASPRPNR